MKKQFLAILFTSISIAALATDSRADDLDDHEVNELRSLLEHNRRSAPSAHAEITNAQWQRVQEGISLLAENTKSISARLEQLDKSQK